MIRRRCLAAFALVAALLAPATSRAATTSAIDVSAGWLSRAPSGTTSPELRFVPLRLTPSFLVDRPKARWHLDGAVTRFEEELRLDEARLGGSFLSRWGHSLAGELLLEAVRTETRGDGVEAAAQAKARLHYAGRAVGGWLGVVATASSKSAERDRLSRLDVGAWARRRRLSFSTNLDQSIALVREYAAGHYDSAAVALDPRNRQVIPLTKHVIVTSALTMLHWNGEHLEVDAGAGTTVSSRTRPQRWLRAGGAYWLSPGIALSATAGTRPEGTLRLDGASHGYVTLGVRVATARAASNAVPIVAGAQALECALRSLGDGRWLVRVRALGARTVELMGDVTNWGPLALQRVNAEWWEVSLPMASGVHQIDLRLDGGEWTPPPGMPTAQDGYSGDVGVVVID